MIVNQNPEKSIGPVDRALLQHVLYFIVIKRGGGGGT